MEVQVGLKINEIKFLETSDAYIPAERVNVIARDLSSTARVRGLENKIKVAMIHPERIVPIARRFKAFTRFLFSSLVGDRGLKSEFELKQNKTIRREYTAVNSVARKEIIRLKNLEKLVRDNSSIKSFE